MAISIYDLTKGVDFSALASATAADHNNLVDAATPFTTDKGIVMVSNDTALNTPDVPNPNASASYLKWKNYVWIRRPHSTAPDTTPLLYAWNENAVSVVTYLKWQRIEADTTDLQAQIDALDLRVQDVEASVGSALAAANAANALAATANINANSALSTANAANVNALQALSDLNTPTTGVVARVTALETRMTAAESQITVINTQITNINTQLSSGLGPLFITPVTLYTGTGTAYTTIDLSSQVPSTTKAAIFETTCIGTAGVSNVDLSDCSVLARRTSGAPEYTLLVAKTFANLTPSFDVNQSMMPLSATRTFDLYVPTITGTAITVKLVGYVV